MARAWSEPRRSRLHKLPNTPSPFPKREGGVKDLTMAGTPISITLYGEGDEVLSTHTRMFVPWKILKAAVRLSKELDVNDMTEADVDALAGLVVEAFGNQFSVEDLDAHADVSDMVAVLQMIVGKATSGLSNFIQPGK